ncbi:MAG: GTP 3',8-cyclase MoaA [Alicyclobacillaceae bacterium]|nr:GTP 3',8-cyclase MoaA [Alicyclobacillaceae bacterium]
MAVRKGVRVSDRLGRPLQDLRVSVTDRCNFRCTYCMPRAVFGPDYPFFRSDEVLTFDEIVRIVRACARLGVRKVRLTGGEPLLRPGLEQLIAALRSVEGIDEVAMTTNGSMLDDRRARMLKAAGLDRVTISLDSLDDAVVRRLNDAPVSVRQILAAVAAALAAGLTPVKVNMVVIRGINEHEVVPLAEQFRGTGVIVRFIEYMDVGHSNGWRREDVVAAAEILDHISARWPLEPMPPRYPGEVASRYRYLDGAGEIGVIASVTQPFCQGCTRARLTADGQLYTCLFGTAGLSLRSLLRQGASEDELVSLIRETWSARADRYSELRAAGANGLEDGRYERSRRVEMPRIGG